MTDFTKSLAGFRNVETHNGDTVRRVSLRELGDASRWYEIVNLNGLRYPYITDDPLQVSSTVILSGSKIKVPSSSPTVTAETDPNTVFGTDVMLTNGVLTAVNGDMATVSGLANLDQALINVVNTNLGELIYHPLYGCSARRIVGSPNDLNNAFLMASFVKRSLESDPRISRADKATVTITGDVMQADAVATAIDGQRVYSSSSYGISG